jgi:hypothetical protein
VSGRGGPADRHDDLERPDVFAAGAALSPGSYVPQPPSHSSANRHPAGLDAEGNYDPKLWEQLNFGCPEVTVRVLTIMLAEEY